MNAKEILLSCNIEKAAALHFTQKEPPVCQDWKAFLQMHLDFAAQIADIQPIPSDNVVLSIHFYTDDKPYYEIRMYCKSELLNNFRRCQAWEEDRTVASYSEAELEQLTFQTLGYVFPEFYDMELMPWKELLGAEVLKENVDTFGRELLAAVIIWEISFWGLSYEGSFCGQNRVWAHIQEIMREICIPQSTSVEDALEELKTFDDGEMPVLDEVLAEDSPDRFYERSATDWV